MLKLMLFTTVLSNQDMFDWFYMVSFFVLCVCVQWSPELQGKEAVCYYGASAIIKGGHYGEK